MRDILAGGSLVLTGSRPQFFRLPAKPRRRLARRGRQPGLRSNRSPIADVAVQPGQLASPHLKFGFPSLAVH